MEAATFVANSRGEAILAGTPNAVTRVTPDGKVAGGVADSIFGALVRPDGTAWIVPAPVEGRLLNGIRVLARTDGKWDALFAEVKPFSGDERPDTAARLWYGTYDGSRWSHLEEIPLPAGKVHPLLAATPLQRGDTLFWAMPMTTLAHQRYIALFERHGGRWSATVVPPFHARAELAYSDTLGLLLAVTGGSIQPRGGFNSLILRKPNPPGEPLRLVVEGEAEGPVHVPSLSLSPVGGVLSWHTITGDHPENYRREARAMLGRIEEQNGPVIVLDSSVAMRQYPFSPVVMSPGQNVWVTEHVSDVERRSEIRFIHGSEHGAVVLGRIPNPYLPGFLGAVALSPAELLISGLQYFPHRYIVSLLLRTRLECRGTAP